MNDDLWIPQDIFSLTNHPKEPICVRYEVCWAHRGKLTVAWWPAVQP